MLSRSHTSSKMIFCGYLFLLFLGFSSCSVTKTYFVYHKVSDGLKVQCLFHCNITLIPSHQISATATITHFYVLFNSNCSAHSQILVCSTFALFCFHDFSVQPCHQLCLFLKSSCIHLFTCTCTCTCILNGQLH